MNINKFFNPQNYFKAIKKIKCRFIASSLIKIPVSSVELESRWKILPVKKESKSQKLFSYQIFGIPIDLENSVDWHKDYISGFEYPCYRIDKLEISQWYNKGIDVKFPWELSRFYFALLLAQEYNKTGNIDNYHLFKNLVIDWTQKNPFCHGVNWHCTMEVAIRAVNWIVAINLFGDIFKNDYGFQRQSAKSLVQHANYISAFPELYDKGLTTNHTTADYTGLLFLALTLSKHPDSKKWLKQAVAGLESCVRHQTYDDGVNFEGSIPYHRLVLEMFAFSAILCRANNVKLTSGYYVLLFMMFEYTAAYMDHNGNAPQVGDNDSGRLVILQNNNEHDHSYLLDLGEHIFDYKFRSQCKKRNPEIKKWLPITEKINIGDLNLTPRETEKSVSFKKGGAYFLKNEKFSILISCFPPGMNGKGAHNHYDKGSFTLSVNGIPVIVDPGTCTYTRSFEERNRFRRVQSHNVVYKEVDEETFSGTEEIFRLNNYLAADCIDWLDNKIIIKVNNLANNYCYTRTFEVNNSILVITDQCDGVFFSNYHIHPDNNVALVNENTVEINAQDNILTVINDHLTVTDYFFSNSYEKKLIGEIIISEQTGQTITKIILQPK